MSEQRIEDRMVGLAEMLREEGAIVSGAVYEAFAAVPRHRCVTWFLDAGRRIDVPQDSLPDSEVLDAIYSSRALPTFRPHGARPASSSSQTPLMARVLEALRLAPGMRVLEIGAGTGYNAALITTITGTDVITVEAGAEAAEAAATAVHRLGLGERIHVHHSDGHLGAPTEGPFDRIVVTCGIAGIPPGWLDQLATNGMILAPVTLGGVHPVMKIRPDDPPRVRPLLWCDFMPAIGPLCAAELFDDHHDPGMALPPAPITRLPDAVPVLTEPEYDDLWCHLAIHDVRTTRAVMAGDGVDPRLGVCALLDDEGTAWVQRDGAITHTGHRGLADHLTALTRRWHAQGRLPLTHRYGGLRPAAVDPPLLIPSFPHSRR